MLPDVDYKNIMFNTFVYMKAQIITVYSRLTISQVYIKHSHKQFNLQFNCATYMATMKLTGIVNTKISSKP